MKPPRLPSTSKPKGLSRASRDVSFSDRLVQCVNASCWPMSDQIVSRSTSGFNSTICLFSTLARALFITLFSSFYIYFGLTFTFNVWRRVRYRRIPRLWSSSTSVITQPAKEARNVLYAICVFSRDYPCTTLMILFCCGYLFSFE